MPKKIPNYEEESQKALRRNDAEVVSFLELKNKDLIKKIKNFSDKHGFSEKEIIKEVKSNQYFRSVFAKDPGKQKIHENTAAKFIKGLSKVRNFKQLAHGDLVLIGGAVMSKKDMIRQGGRNKAKTIDFYWEIGDRKIYASHKYTKEGGGAQDNQYNDLQEFINEANHSSLRDTFFLAIADGDYYKTKDTAAGVTKIEYLKGLANRRNMIALTIDELENWLNKIK